MKLELKEINHSFTLVFVVLRFFLSVQITVLVKENEVPTEQNSSRASIFAAKASYISN